MTTCDVLVLGGGIAGLESARRLADMGFQVVVVEKEASVGGRVAQLGRVYPGLEPAAEIVAPLMKTVAEHQSIRLMTFAEVAGVSASPDGGRRVSIRRKPRFVDLEACQACGDCAKACTVAVPDPFNFGLVDRRAAHMMFPGSVPNKSLLQRDGTSPCTSACPAGIKSHGYVSLVRAGKFDLAFKIVLEATPLVGTLGRVCFAFCEAGCTHASIDRPIPIRRLKRFVADSHYATGEGPGVWLGKPVNKRVAIVGSGPAGITAAWRLARKGYTVKVFEAAPVAGGFMRLAIPGYRLPVGVVEADLSNVTALGVEIAVDSPVADLEALKAEGFDAVLVATGTSRSNLLDIPGGELAGSMPALDFMRAVKAGTAPNLRGRRVVVIGGGNVAMDTARASVRLGAAATIVAYRRGRAEMPARPGEVEDAQHEGVEWYFLAAPVGVVDDGRGNVAGLRCIRTILGEPDATGRRRPEPVHGSEFTIPCDVILPAIGLRPDLAAFGGMVEATASGTAAADPVTLQTSVPWLFAAGDVVTGPSNVTQAAGQGRRVAHMIDRWLAGKPLAAFDSDTALPVADKAAALARRPSHRPGFVPAPAMAQGSLGFDEIERALSEEEAVASATDCLDCAACCECYECMHACKSYAIRMGDREQTEEIEVGAVIVATGRALSVAGGSAALGSDVITSAQLERMLAPGGPFAGPVRPSDGAAPRTIAYVLDCSTGNAASDGPGGAFLRANAIKQVRLVREALPDAAIAVHVRASGANAADELRAAVSTFGAECVAGAEPSAAAADLVVLAVGLQAGDGVGVFGSGSDGTFLAGTAAGTSDIASTLDDARLAAERAAAYLGTRARPA
jgi:NADPH-dependent glutamate synthase beta subunit-like oxidoreductase